MTYKNVTADEIRIYANIAELIKGMNAEQKHDFACVTDGMVLAIQK